MITDYTTFSPFRQQKSTKNGATEAHGQNPLVRRRGARRTKIKMLRRAFPAEHFFCVNAHILFASKRKSHRDLVEHVVKRDRAQTMIKPTLDLQFVATELVEELRECLLCLLVLANRL